MPTPARRRTKHLSGPGLLIGYARVSTEEQNLALQLEALKKAEEDAKKGGAPATTGSTAPAPQKK